MWRMGVPVATPIGAADIWAAAAALLQRKNASPELAEAVSARLDGLPVRFAASGRVALYATLAALAGAIRDRERDEVVIPAFICPSVARTVIKAGLRPRLCDVVHPGFELDPADCERVAGPRTIAIVTAHLFGYPHDVDPILKIARQTGAALIEDAAQAFGARFCSRPVGTRGDAGVFSFGMSKVIFAAGGGVAVFRNAALAPRFDEVMRAARDPSLLRRTRTVAKFAAAAALVRSHHIGPIAHVWAGNFRGRGDADDFAVEAHNSVQAAAARSVLPRLDAIVACRRGNARWFAGSLSCVRGITIPETDARAEPVYLRFPVIVHDIARRQRILRSLSRCGVNATGMYDAGSRDLLYALVGHDRRCCAAEYLFDRMVNLPTHQYLSRRDREQAVAAFAG